MVQSGLHLLEKDDCMYLLAKNFLTIFSYKKLKQNNANFYFFGHIFQKNHLISIIFGTDVPCTYWKRMVIHIFLKKIWTPTFYRKLKQRKKSFQFLAISWINRLIYLYIWYKRALYLLKKDWLYIFSSKQFLLPFFYKKLKQRKAYFQFY